MSLLLYYLISISLFIRTLNISLFSSLLDFQYYLDSANLYLHYQNPYVNLLYPPASLLIFTPFSLFPFAISKLLWTILSILSLFLGIYVFTRQLNTSFKSHKLSPTTITLIFFLFYIQTFPVKFTLGLGQVNLFVFLGYAIFFRALQKNQDIIAGVSLAIITILKFNPIFFVIYLLVIKKYKSILVFILSIFSLNLITDIFSPYHLNISFIQSLINMSTSFSGYYYNQSLAAFLSRQISHQNTTVFINIFLTIFFWTLTIKQLVTKHHHTPRNFFLFLLTILITSPLTWQHHLLFTIPIFIYYVPQIISNHKSLLTISILISFILINTNIKTPQLLNPQNPIYSHAFFGLLSLFLVAYLSENK